MAKPVAVFVACGTAIGLGVACGSALGGIAAAGVALRALAPGILQSLLYDILKHGATGTVESSSTLGRNHDIVRLVSDAASHCVRELAEKRPLWKLHLWGERWSLERAAKRLGSVWEVIELTSVGASCRSTQIVEWFQTSMTDAVSIASPFTEQQWSKFLEEACPNLNGPLRQELADHLYVRFTHWIRQRFKDDFGGKTPAQGRAYAALQMALLGGLYDVLAKAADSTSQIKTDTGVIRQAMDQVTQRVDALASDSLFVKFPALLQETRDAGRKALSLIERVHAPRITLPTPDKSDSASRFVYRNERIRVVGRDEELRELTDWLEDKRPFSWDLWTGPAGAGKSRLALQLCRRFESTWNVGFYDWQYHSQVRWDIWTPNRDTLMVFDYVAEHATEIGQIVRSLADRNWPGGRRVRALLLEREILRSKAGATEMQSDPQLTPLPAWLDLFLKEGRQAGAKFRLSHAHKNLDRPERPIEGVSIAALGEILQEDADLEDHPLEEAELVRRLALIVTIDPRRRPLFAAMTAEVLREGGDVAPWSVDSLVQHVLQRERDRWNKALTSSGLESNSQQAPWLRLACLSTICGSLQSERLDAALADPLASKSGLPSATAWVDGTVYRLLVSGGGSRDALKLEPDILGEAFVLWQLDGDSMIVDSLIALAWKRGVGDFIGRAAHNFPEHSMIDQFLRPREEADPAALAAAHLARSMPDERKGDMQRISERGQALATDNRQPGMVRSRG
ncbi:MAG: hypothetical protein IH898_13160, partial [Planctomycetes bacterium]|nr:hypothetical protein [Planctomycetota bacterium]